MTTPDEAERARLRKLWVAYCKRPEAHSRAWVEWYVLNQGPQPTSEPWPDELRGMTSGARTRAGTPCKHKDLYRRALQATRRIEHRPTHGRGQGEGRAKRMLSEGAVSAR
jgi:hypothetical protein